MRVSVVDSSLDEIQERKENGTRMKIGLVVGVVLIVAVTVWTGRSNGFGDSVKTSGLIEKGPGDKTDARGLFKLDGDRVIVRQIEKEIEQMSGVRVQIVKPAEALAAMSKGKMQLAGDTAYGPYGIGRYYGSPTRYLSVAVAGSGAPVNTATSVGANEKWIVNGGWSTEFESDAHGGCITMSSSGSVFMASCSDNAAKFMVCRMGINYDPKTSWSHNLFALYAYSSARKFLSITTSGTVGSTQTPYYNGIVKFV